MLPVRTPRRRGARDANSVAVTASTVRKLGITRYERAYATIAGRRCGVTGKIPARDTLPVTTRGEDSFKMTAEPCPARDARSVVEQPGMSPELSPVCRALFA